MDRVVDAALGSARARETRVLFFLTVVLAPAAAIAIVGGYGLLLWFYQMLAGPPSS